MTFVSPQGTYRVIRELARGGMGVTWLVSAEGHGEPLVLKELKLAGAESWKDVELFRREASVLQGLDHPAIPRYIDFFESPEGDGLFLVQAYIAGRTLREMVGERVSPGRLTELLVQALDILSYLHGLVPPVIHRDITPQNLIVSPDGRLHLVDFGAVRSAVSPQQGLETTIGTFGYMSPEQLLGRADGRVDLYGLGMTLVALAAGRDVTAMARDQATGRVDLGVLNALPPALRRTLRAMTEMEWEDRVASAQKALALLRSRPKRGPLARAALGLGLMVMILTGLWASTLVADRGEIATLGGWFSGHGSTLSAVTATLFGAPRLVSHAAEVSQVIFSPGGERLISATAEGELILWDIPSGALLRRWQEPRLSQMVWMAFSPDGRTLAAATARNLLLYDASTWAVQGDVSFRGEELHHGLALAGGRIKVAMSAQGDILVQDILQGRRRPGASLRAGPVEAMTLSPEGESVAFVAGGSRNHRVRLWDIRSNSVTDLPGVGRFHALAFSPDGRYLAYTDMNELHLWDRATRRCHTREDFASLSDIVALSSGLAVIVPIYERQRAKLHPFQGQDALRFHTPRLGPGHRDAILNVAFSPDGALMATSSRDQTVKLWRVADL